MVSYFNYRDAHGYSWSGTGSSGTGGGGGSGGGSCTQSDYDDDEVPNIACTGVSWIYYKFEGTPYSGSGDGTFSVFQPEISNKEFKIPAGCSVAGGFWHFGTDIQWNINGDREYTSNLIKNYSDSSKLSTSNGKYGHAATWTWVVSSWDEKIINWNKDNSRLYHYVKIDGANGWFKATRYAKNLDQVVKAYNNATGSKVTNDSFPSDLYAFCAGDEEDPYINTVDTTSRMRVTGSGLDTGWNESGKDSVTKDSNVVRIVHGSSVSVETKHKGFRSPATSKDKIDFEVSVGKTMKQGDNLTTTVTQKGNGNNFSSTWKFEKNSSEKEWAATNTRSISFNPGAKKWACEGIVHKEKVNSKGQASGDNEKSGYCESIKRPAAYFDGSYTYNITQKLTSGATTQPTIASGKNKAVVTLADDSTSFTISFLNQVQRKDTSSEGTAGETVPTKYKTYVKSHSDYAGGDWQIVGGGSTNETQSELTNALEDSAVVGDTAGTKQTVLNYTFTDVPIKYGETITYCNNLYYKHEVKGDPANLGDPNNGGSYCIEVYRPEKKCALDTSNNGWYYSINHGQNIGRIGARNVTKGQTGFTWTPTDKNNNNWPSVSLMNDVWAKPGDDIQFKYEMCAGAFYVLQENGIKDRGTHYGAEGYLTTETDSSRGNGKYYGTTTDGYLFKKSIPVPSNGDFANQYKNPTSFYSNSYVPLARWTTKQDGQTLMPGNGFLGHKPSGAADYSGQAEASFTSPDSGAGSVYGCSHTGGTVTHNNSYYQVNGKASGCHTDMGASVFDTGGVIKQQLFWNNYEITGVNYDTNPRTAISTNHNPEARYATAYVKVPYNYVLAPYVENKNSTDANKVVYLGEKYKMQPGVGVMGRKNDYVNGDTAYATITKTTHVSVSTYYIHGGTRHYLNNINGASYTVDKRFNSTGNLNNSNENSSLINITIPDDGTISVGDKVCTEISVWPADSHDDPNATVVHGASQGAVALLNNIGLEEGSRYGASNSRSTTSCSQVAKRPTMSVESSNAYSSAGYEINNYTKVFANGGPAFRFSSWSEYGVFGKVVKKDQHLVSGATTAYKTNVAYGTQAENITRANNDTNNTATTSNSSTCVFRTQTFANTNCTENNGHDIGGDSVAQFRQKMVDRYGNIGNGATSGTVTFGGTPYKKVVLNTSNLGSHISNETGPIAIRANAGENLYIGEEGIPTEIPLGVEYDRTIVYNASGQTVVIDGNIDYNRRSGNTNTNLDNIVGVVIIAKNVYITNKPTYIDATIIADEVVNTCRYNGNSTAINGVGNLSASVCNQPLVFDAPVITKKLVLNRTAGAGNGNYSIQRAEIFNLSMANYLWGYNQMSRYSQAITTYSRELPSRY
ncbi:hypothetical protein IKF25_02475 [Candidatus Saccharibacteria bacterium]|nr:hypothetical protein [Candidatus Saccharibacteria bacterium]